jgi:hypothetical protein
MKTKTSEQQKAYHIARMAMKISECRVQNKTQNK